MQMLPIPSRRGQAWGSRALIAFLTTLICGAGSAAAHAPAGSRATAAARLALGAVQRISPYTHGQAEWNSVPSANGRTVLLEEDSPASFTYRLPIYLWRAGVVGRQVVGRGIPTAISNDGRTIAFLCARNVLCITRIGARSVRRITGPCGSLERSWVSGNMRVLLVGCSYGPAEGSTLVQIGSRSVITTRLSTYLAPDGLSDDGATVILERAGSGGSKLYLYHAGKVIRIKRVRPGFLGMSHNGHFIAEGETGTAAFPLVQPIAVLDLQTGQARTYTPTEHVGLPSHHYPFTISDDGSLLAFDAGGVSKLVNVQSVELVSVGAEVAPFGDCPVLSADGRTALFNGSVAAGPKLPDGEVPLGQSGVFVRTIVR